MKKTLNTINNKLKQIDEFLKIYSDFNSNNNNKNLNKSMIQDQKQVSDNLRSIFKLAFNDEEQTQQEAIYYLFEKELPLKISLIAKKSFTLSLVVIQIINEYFFDSKISKVHENLIFFNNLTMSLFNSLVKQILNILSNEKYRFLIDIKAESLVFLEEVVNFFTGIVLKANNNDNFFSLMFNREKKLKSISRVESSNKVNNLITNNRNFDKISNTSPDKPFKTSKTSNSSVSAISFKNKKTNQITLDIIHSFFIILSYESIIFNREIKVSFFDSFITLPYLFEDLFALNNNIISFDILIESINYSIKTYYTYLKSTNNNSYLEIFKLSNYCNKESEEYFKKDIFFNEIISMDFCNFLTVLNKIYYIALNNTNKQKFLISFYTFLIENIQYDIISRVNSILTVEEFKLLIVQNNFELNTIANMFMHTNNNDFNDSTEDNKKAIKKNNKNCKNNEKNTDFMNIITSYNIELTSNDSSNTNSKNKSLIKNKKNVVDLISNIKIIFTIIKILYKMISYLKDSKVTKIIFALIFGISNKGASYNNNNNNNSNSLENIYTDRTKGNLNNECNDNEEDFIKIENQDENYIMEHEYEADFDSNNNNTNRKERDNKNQTDQVDDTNENKSKYKNNYFISDNISELDSLISALDFNPEEEVLINSLDCSLLKNSVFLYFINLILNTQLDSIDLINEMNKSNTLNELINYIKDIKIMFYRLISLFFKLIPKSIMNNLVYPFVSNDSTPGLSNSSIKEYIIIHTHCKRFDLMELFNHTKIQGLSVFRELEYFEDMINKNINYYCNKYKRVYGKAVLLDYDKLLSKYIHELNEDNNNETNNYNNFNNTISYNNNDIKNFTFSHTPKNFSSDNLDIKKTISNTLNSINYNAYNINNTDISETNKNLFTCKTLNFNNIDNIDKNKVSRSSLKKSSTSRINDDSNPNISRRRTNFNSINTNSKFQKELKESKENHNSNHLNNNPTVSSVPTYKDTLELNKNSSFNFFNTKAFQTNNTLGNNNTENSEILRTIFNYSLNFLNNTPKENIFILEFIKEFYTIARISKTSITSLSRIDTKMNNSNREINCYEKSNAMNYKYNCYINKILGNKNSNEEDYSLFAFLTKINNDLRDKLKQLNIQINEFNEILKMKLKISENEFNSIIKKRYSCLLNKGSNNNNNCGEIHSSLIENSLLFLEFTIDIETSFIIEFYLKSIIC